MNRRFVLKAALLVSGAPCGLLRWTGRAALAAEAVVWRHGISQIGNLKYPSGFPHFDYVRVDAPKGGQARQIALGTFDNFNFALGGAKGVLAQGVELVHEQLLVASLDEPASYYGLLAEAVSYPDDFSWTAFRLRPEAKWQDGRPVTAEDVIFSFETLKSVNPQSSADFLHVTRAEKTGEREITFRFDVPGSRELPIKLGALVVFPKHWWESTNEAGTKRNISETTQEPPLGSGPYRVKTFTAAREIVYERNSDYWGKDISVNIGRDNFQELRFEYYRDPTVGIESFKKNGVDWRVENSAKNWATSYDFGAVTEKRVILEEFQINNVGIMQGFAFNTRREKLSDPRVRRAFNHAFDFEELNKQLFYGQYKRITSYFENTELASSGLPSGRELDLLNALRDKVPPEVFTTPFTNPSNGNPIAMRTNFREALRLMAEAGYEIREQQLVNKKTGEQMSLELLSNSPLFERINLFYKPNLERLGIAVNVRTVDSSQYESRLRGWDFDVVTFAWGQTLVPGNEERGYWGSEAADQAGSYNVIGIKNPAVDALIEKIVYAKNYEDLVPACRALDRVLLWNHYVVPQWSYAKVRTARWDRFSRPEKLPTYGMSAFPTLWWFDDEKAAKLGT